MCVQSVHQRWSLQNDANPRVAMTVDSPLMTLGQSKPPFEIEIVVDFFELLLSSGACLLAGFKGGGNLFDVLDVFSDRFLLLPNFAPASVDAIGQSAELLFCEPPAA